MSAQTTAARRKPARRLALPRSVSFWAVAAIALLAFAANAAASPLYRLYQAEFGFSATTLTLVFTVYIVAVLVTLLFLGTVSDSVGRRPVMLAGLAAGAVASTLFLIAHSVAMLFAARALQGVAVGLISPTAGAALLDMRPHGRATALISSAANTLGQAFGALSASTLAQYAVAPTQLIWWFLLGAFIVGIVLVLVMPEPGTTRPLLMSSLRPHAGVPPEARGVFAAVVPCLVGVWALASFYMSLGPSLAAQLLHSSNLVWGGLLIFLLTGIGAAGAAVLARKNAYSVMQGGCLALIGGAVVTFIAIQISAPAVLFLGTAVAGFGFGSAFTGAYRATVALAGPDDRAGLVTAIFIVSYVASGIPVVIGGVAASHYGLHETALVYSMAVAVLATLAFGLMIREARRSQDLRTPTARPDQV